MNFKHFTAASGALLAAGALSAAGLAPASAAETTTLVGQAVYTCNSQVEGSSDVWQTFEMTVQMQLTAPASVKPGQVTSLYGTVKIQLSEETRQVGQTLGVTSMDFYSNSLSIVGTTAGRATRYPADRVQSGPTKPGNPLVLGAPLNVQVRVPADATGAMQFQMMQNDSVPTSLQGTSRPKVAFNLVTRAISPTVQASPRTACYLAHPNAAVIGKVPVGAKATVSPTAPTTTGSADVKSNAASGVGPAAGPPANPGLPGPRSTGTAAPSTVTPDGAAAVSPTTVPVASPIQEPSGVYVSTSLLVLVGFAICAMSIAYAALANYRLRSIQRAIGRE